MVPRIFLAFRSPPLGSDGYYAASVCGAIMGMRKGSRIHQALVRDQEVASDANMFTFDLSKGTDLLIADVTARPGVSAEKLEEALVGVLETVQRDGIGEQELARALALIETDFVTALQSAGDRADLLSKFATYFGDATLVNEQLARYRAVTVAEVNAFAREFLGADNRASLVYVPRTKTEAA